MSSHVITTRSDVLKCQRTTALREVRALACSKGICTRTRLGYLSSAQSVVYALDSRSTRIGRDAAVVVAPPCPTYHASYRGELAADNGLLLGGNPLFPSTPLRGKSLVGRFPNKLIWLA